MTAEAAAGQVANDSTAKKNAVVLAAAQALAGAVAPINFALGPIVAHGMLGEDKSMATLPITSFVVGTALGAVPAALLMRRFGRRSGLILGMIIGAAGGLLNAHAVNTDQFLQLCLGTFLMGFAAAYVQQMRFAAADTASPSFRPRAISYVLVGGILAAVIGPQTVIHAGRLFESFPFAAAYLGASCLSILAVLVLAFLDIPKPVINSAAPKGRPVSEIARQPEFLVAVGCAVSSYALMNFMMTSAPLAMVLHHHHHDLAVLGIQWHVLAMYGPSFVTGSLIARFGAVRIVSFGLLLLIVTGAVALSGTSVGHFWTALILLGLGWNFGFIGATALVTETYRPVEKERVQALNDALIFGFVALASFSSGEVLIYAGWNLVSVIVMIIAFVSLAGLLLRTRRPARLI